MTIGTPEIPDAQLLTDSQVSRFRPVVSGAGPGTKDVPGIELALVAARAAEAKNGDDTLVLEVGSVLGITDHFVITGAGNTRQARTIAQEIERQVKLVSGEGPRRIEGKDDARWLLMDYGDFVVHIFLAEARAYYDLERLWSDVPRVQWRIPAE
ncbi:MAG: ribosome silencing factor [Acidimicrobiales bacterium]